MTFKHYNGAVSKNFQSWSLKLDYCSMHGALCTFNSEKLSASSYSLGAAPACLIASLLQADLVWVWHQVGGGVTEHPVAVSCMPSLYVYTTLSTLSTLTTVFKKQPAHM